MTQRDEKGRLKKGARLNPGGRHAKRKEIEKLFQDGLEVNGENVAVRDLVDMATDSGNPPKDRKACYELALAYAYGKPTQRKEVSIEGELDLGSYSMTELEDEVRKLLSGEE